MHLLSASDDLGWISNWNRIFFCAPCYYSSCSDNTPSSNCDSIKNYCTCSDPYIVFDDDPLGIIPLVNYQNITIFMIMCSGIDPHMRPHENIIPNLYSSSWKKTWIWSYMCIISYFKISILDYYSFSDPWSLSDFFISFIPDFYSKIYFYKRKTHNVSISQ